MPALTLWLVRHGQSTANAGAPAVAEVPLTALGHSQARDAAACIDRAPDLLAVSPLLRAVQTAHPIQARWPDTRSHTWPIEEFTYLSPGRCSGTTTETRRPWVTAYWDHCDPTYVDGAGAESFAGFMARLSTFHRQVLGFGPGFLVVVGHGQFFRAYEMALRHGFGASAEDMRRFRLEETGNPMRNGEILDLSQALIGHTAG